MHAAVVVQRVAPLIPGITSRPMRTDGDGATGDNAQDTSGLHSASFDPLARKDGLSANLQERIKSNIAVTDGDHCDVVAGIHL